MTRHTDTMISCDWTIGGCSHLVKESELDEENEHGWWCTLILHAPDGERLVHHYCSDHQAAPQDWTKSQDDS